MAEPLQKLHSCFNDLGFKVHHLADNTSLSHDLELDSTDFEKLLREIEARFQVSVPVPERTFIIALGDVRKLIVQRRK